MTGGRRRALVPAGSDADGTERVVVLITGHRAESGREVATVAAEPAGKLPRHRPVRRMTLRPPGRKVGRCKALGSSPFHAPRLGKLRRTLRALQQPDASANVAAHGYRLGFVMMVWKRLVTSMPHGCPAK